MSATLLRAAVLPAMLLAAAAAAQCPAGSPPALLNEVLYDAAGDDTGREFVELLNPWPFAVSLAGLRVEAGDGSAPGRWTLRWEGAAGDSVAPHARFVVGGRLVTPPPDREAELNLQNGPDAVRLSWPDGVVEVVGWGAHEFADYYCGAPAADAPSGGALVRRPDGARRGSNAADFEPAAPSPGAANQVARDVALQPGSLALQPESPGPGQPFTLRAALINQGAEFLHEGEVGVRVWAWGAGADSLPLAADAVDRTLSPGDTLGLAWPLVYARAGKLRLHLQLLLADNGRPEGDHDSISVRFGPGPLTVSEINFQPPAGEPEWIEVRAREPTAPDGWRLADSRDSPGRVDAPGAVLEPDSLGLLTGDRAALLTRRPELDAGRVWQVTPWPALNNADGDAGFADRVTLREPDSTLSESVAYSAAGVPAGATLERVDGGEWRPVDGGSPLRPPRALPPARSRWEVEPARWRPATGSPLLLRYALPWPGRAAVELYDLAGRLRSRLVPEREAPPRGEWRMEAADAKGLAPGYYLVVLRARPRAGAETLVERRVLRVEGVAP